MKLILLFLSFYTNMWCAIHINIDGILDKQMCIYLPFQKELASCKAILWGPRSTSYYVFIKRWVWNIRAISSKQRYVLSMKSCYLIGVILKKKLPYFCIPHLKALLHPYCVFLSTQNSTTHQVFCKVISCAHQRILHSKTFSRVK